MNANGRRKARRSGHVGDRGVLLRRYLLRSTVLASIAYAVWHHLAPAVIDETGRFAVELPSIGTLAAGTLLFLGVNVCAACAWGEIVDPDHSILTSKARSCRVWMLSNIGKYLPGGVFHYAGRYALGRNEGLGKAESIAALVLEMASIVTIALLVGLPGLPHMLSTSVSETFGDRVRTGLVVPAAGLALLAVALVAVLSGSRRVGRTRPLGRLSTVREGLRLRLSRRRVRLSWATSSLYQLGGFLLAGAAANTLIAAGGATEVAYVTLTSAYALAFLAGFVVIGAPGGIGVRELALVALLSPSTGAAAALDLAVGLRVCSMLADVIGAGLAALGDRGRPPTDLPPGMTGTAEPSDSRPAGAADL